VRHGEPQEGVPVDVWLGDDPDLAMVNADMAAWDEAHPCDCHALCECDTTDDHHVIR
jgi:hypothetical protein